MSTLHLVRKNEKVIPVYLGDDKYIGFTKNTYRKFKHSYFEALKEVELKGLDTTEYGIVSSSGDVINLSCAKYVISYLETSFEEAS